MGKPMSDDDKAGDETTTPPSSEDEDSAFDVMGMLLTPFLWIEKAWVWVHNKFHPDDPEQL